mmetsp:Transcript_6230/g.14674  ORF Transcript_6230/g.14674 Transcript_6230/m.14674 type:complete len:372 (+) Transcript_6230:1196-2311(+)
MLRRATKPETVQRLQGLLSEGSRRQRKRRRPLRRSLLPGLPPPGLLRRLFVEGRRRGGHRAPRHHRNRVFAAAGESSFRFASAVEPHRAPGLWRLWTKTPPAVLRHQQHQQTRPRGHHLPELLLPERLYQHHVRGIRLRRLRGRAPAAAAPLPRAALQRFQRTTRTRTTTPEHRRGLRGVRKDHLFRSPLPGLRRLSVDPHQLWLRPGGGLSDQHRPAGRKGLVWKPRQQEEPRCLEARRRRNRRRHRRRHRVLGVENPAEQPLGRRGVDGLFCVPFENVVVLEMRTERVSPPTPTNKLAAWATRRKPQRRSVRSCLAGSHPVPDGSHGPAEIGSGLPRVAAAKTTTLRFSNPRNPFTKQRALGEDRRRAR